MNQETWWPHAPPHNLSEKGAYFVTTRTHRKLHHFQGSARHGMLHRGLLQVAHEFQWQLEAWAVFSNHYHFVAHSPVNDPDAESLSPMLNELHAKTARWVNQQDDEDGRKVWHNY